MENERETGGLQGDMGFSFFRATHKNGDGYRDHERALM